MKTKNDILNDTDKIIEELNDTSEIESNILSIIEDLGLNKHKLIFHYEGCDTPIVCFESELPESLLKDSLSLTNYFNQIFEKEIQDFLERKQNNQPKIELFSEKLFPEEMILPYYSHGYFSGGWFKETIKNDSKILIPDIPTIQVYLLEDWFQLFKRT